PDSEGNLAPRHRDAAGAWGWADENSRICRLSLRESAFFRGAKDDQVSVLSAVRTWRNRNSMKTILSEVGGFHQPSMGVGFAHRGWYHDRFNGWIGRLSPADGNRSGPGVCASDGSDILASSFEWLTNFLR